jgi:hypothetical protein
MEYKLSKEAADAVNLLKSWGYKVETRVNALNESSISWHGVKGKTFSPNMIGASGAIDRLENAGYHFGYADTIKPGVVNVTYVKKIPVKENRRVRA